MVSKFSKLKQIHSNKPVQNRAKQDISSWDTPRLKQITNKSNMQKIIDDFDAIDIKSKEWQWD